MTSSPSSFFPRLSLSSSGRNSPLLPTHNSPNRHSPRRRSLNEYPLSELSPRPSSPLLSPDHDNDPDMQREYSSSPRGKGKGKAVAYAEPAEQFPPMSVVDRMRIKRESRAAAKEQMRQSMIQFEARRTRGKPSWLPPSPPEFRDEEDQEEGVMENNIPRSTGSRQSYAPQVSFVESVFIGRAQSTTDRRFAGEVDTTLRVIQQRERQMHKELQRLLDAQTAALERAASGDPAPRSMNGASTTGSNTPTRGFTSSRSRIQLHDYESATTAPVIPVRQPRSKLPSPRQVRTNIARSITLLANLKAEEDACIESALLERKTALAKANKLSTQHKRILADLRALETDKNAPIQRDLDSMQKEHQSVCSEIEVFEQKLRMLKSRKGALERKMEEVRSEKDSELSGYRGALREAERGIGDMMRRPPVKILEVDGITNVNAETAEESNGSKEPRISGQEFMSLQPERRTLGMAKEWWEGEVAILERRQAATQREMAALNEGAEVWEDTVKQIGAYERRLENALRDSTAFVKQDQKLFFRTQIQDIRQTIKDFRKSLEYADDRGWNLLVAAIGAELDGFLEGEKIFFGMMQANGIELPEFNMATKGSTLVIFGSDSEKDVHQSRKEAISENHDDGEEEQDELSGSAVRCWTEPSSDIEAETTHAEGDEKDKSAQETGGTEGKQDSKYRDESDNEVPRGLFSEAHVEESEDEHNNEVPAEFLSMHADKLNGPGAMASPGPVTKGGKHDDVD